MPPRVFIRGVQDWIAEKRIGHCETRNLPVLHSKAETSSYFPDSGKLCFIKNAGANRLAELDDYYSVFGRVNDAGRRSDA
jgi:hypothetical protein